MSNRASYHAMMNEVRAPERVLGKAKDITMEKTKRAPLALRYATVAVASLLSVFAVTNGVCYAATGETWIEHFTTTIDGQQVDITVTGQETMDGNAGEVVVTANSDSGDVVLYDSTSGATAEVNGDAAVASEKTTSFSVSTGDGGAMVAEGDDGSVHLVVGDADPVDITEDMADGHAEVTVEVDGQARAYTVTGQSGSYEAHLS